jgi:hypothetical protein
MNLVIFAMLAAVFVVAIVLAFRHYFKPPNDAPNLQNLVDDEDDESFNFDFETERDRYLDAKELQEQTHGDLLPVKKALLQRTIAGVEKIVRMQKQGPKVVNNQRAGLLQDGVWEKFQKADKELTAELEEIKAEAELLGWDKKFDIFKQAFAIYTCEQKKKAIAEHEAKLQEQIAERAKYVDTGDSERQSHEKPTGSSSSKTRRLHTDTKPLPTTPPSSIPPPSSSPSTNQTSPTIQQPLSPQQLKNRAKKAKTKAKTKAAKAKDSSSSSS